MKDTKTVFIIFLIVAALALEASAHRRWRHYSESESESEEQPEYPCAPRFRKYYLDNEPAEKGLSVGFVSPGKRAYIGLGSWQKMTLNTGPLTVDPPGILLPNNGGIGSFVNDSDSVWFLRARNWHQYAWENCTNAETVPYAVDFGTTSVGSPHYFGRYRKGNTTFIGIVPLYLGKMYYVDANGRLAETSEGIRVLTCRSYYEEEPRPMPSVVPPNSPPNVDVGCINNWVKYELDDAPLTKGIKAGEFDCGNDAYVGKGNPGGTWIPGRIQAVGDRGLYVTQKGKETRLTNDVYYLADNPSYTYRWTPFSKSLPDNAVNVRSPVGNLRFAVTRVKEDGHYKIGKFFGLEAEFTNANGQAQFYQNYEVLTCDPIPKYKCSQTWKKYNLDSAPSADGFNAGISGDTTVFIGRGLQQCTYGCDFGLGRIQIEPASAAGVYYRDELNGKQIFDTTTAEYLVRNVNDTYVWQPSLNGQRVPNAIELHKEGHLPFYIGSTSINHNVFVGKVRPGEGLYYLDLNGKQKISGSYNVLTCFSPDPTEGEYTVGPEESWFGSNGCPLRKEWSFTQNRCVCKDEFREIFAPADAIWIEESCSYRGIV